MCGIGGFSGEGDNATLERMTGSLARRGPDDKGTFFHGQVGLAHTRLSIIDLSHDGHQPMESSNGRTAIVFNGEIYNFQELRKEIEGKGKYRFKSKSDTEVILALYEMYGTAAFARLNGMFALALYDKEKEELILARDRMGKKPLYWGVFDGTLIFGSELKALMCHSAFKKEIDPRAVQLYLTYEYVPTPFSIFKGVRKLGAGSFLVFKKGAEPREERFWDIPTEAHEMPFAEALKGLDTRLSASIESRLVSDVPVGILLSGGLDSSTIAYYAEKAGGGKLKTFSIGFTDSDFDESKYALEVARSLGVEHITEHFSPEKCIELIPEVFSYLDEPLADASVLPTYLLSSFTRRHVSVALGGDGGDELFAGYPTFQAEALVGAYSHIPNIVRHSVIEPLIKALPVSHSNFSLDFKLKKFLEGTEGDRRYRHQHWLEAFSADDARAMLANPNTASPYALLDGYFRNTEVRGDYLNDVLRSYMRTYLMDEVLVKVDRASMAHGLEVRTPFLDYTLVEFVQQLPYRYKFSGLTGKYILKRLMADKLSGTIVHRKKKGFGIPLGRWLQKELKPLADELLSKGAIEKSGVFAWSAVHQLQKEHEEGTRDNRKKLWTLMAFQLWYNAFA